MKKIKTEIIFDDAGNDIYIINGKYLTFDLFCLYKSLHQSKELKANNFDKIKQEINTKLSNKDTMVGIFFIIDGKVYSDKKMVESFDNNLKLFDYPMCHMIFFDMIDALYMLDIIKEKEYNNFSRGSVMYDNEFNCFKLFVDPNIVNDKQIRDLILRDFNLTDKVNMFYADKQYLSI